MPSPDGTDRQAPGTVPEAPPDVTVVLPTYNERDSLPSLLRALGEVLPRQGFRSEVLVVDDDSPDGTAEVARSMPMPVPLTVRVRKGERGLASAILLGLREARGRVAVVMDADGSHPVGTVPPLARAILGREAEMALASRYMRGGETRDWPLGRRLISHGATFLARPLTSARDPMSGFFAVDRSILDRTSLDPVGYKIALEILVRSRPFPIKEVPFVFTERSVGQSKMGTREIARYLRHLGRLSRFRIFTRRPRAHGRGGSGGPSYRPGEGLDPQG
jgi:dolichol-phosphate mannosyltransferase